MPATLWTIGYKKRGTRNQPKCVKDEYVLNGLGGESPFPLHFSDANGTRDDRVLARGTTFAIFVLPGAF
jgi:hypothetical protein